MIHKLTIGHFDVEALKERRLVVVRPLDMSVVTRLVQELGKVSDEGGATVGGYPVEFHEGYIVSPWLGPTRNEPAEEFARRLYEETNCLLYDAGRREMVTPEQFRDW